MTESTSGTPTTPGTYTFTVPPGWATASFAVSASVSASTHRRHLLSSAGLDHVSEGTGFGMYADADNRVYEVLSKRTLPSEAEVERLVQLQRFETVAAPFDGVISARGIDIGTLVNAEGRRELFHLVQSGTLRVGDSVVAGAAWGKVKALIDDRGEQVKDVTAVILDRPRHKQLIDDVRKAIDRRFGAG